MDNDILELRKALDTSTTNGNNVLDPVLLSKIISEQSRKIAATRNMIARIPFPGKVYTWDTEVTPGDAQTATDGATLNLTDGVYSQAQAAMSYFYQVGYITNPAIQSASELVDLVAMRVGGATKAVIRKEGAAIFNGDPLNSQNPGLLASLKASNTYGLVGDGATLSSSMLDAIEIGLFAQGYQLDAWVVSPGVYKILKQASFNKAGFLTIEGGGQFGFPVAGNSMLMFNGKPVIMDAYAATLKAVTNETLSGSGVTYTFANTPVNPAGVAGLTDQAGTALPAPVVKVSGSTVTNYTIAGNTVTFAATPGAAPTASYSFMNENAYGLSLNPADLCIAEQMAIQVDRDLANPVQQDSVPFRVKEYSVLAVRNPLAHAVASGIVLPTSLTNF